MFVIAPNCVLYTPPSLKDQLLFEVESVAARNPEQVVIVVLSLKEGKGEEKEEEQKGKANEKMGGTSFWAAVW